MKAPRLPSIFKHRENKQFKIPSRYYDPRKERIAELENRYANKEENDNTYSKPKNLNFRESPTHDVFGKGQSNKVSNIRLLVIILALSAIAYYVIFHLTLPEWLLQENASLLHF